MKFTRPDRFEISYNETYYLDQKIITQSNHNIVVYYMLYKVVCGCVLKECSDVNENIVIIIK